MEPPNVLAVVGVKNTIMRLVENPGRDVGAYFITFLTNPDFLPLNQGLFIMFINDYITRLLLWTELFAVLFRELAHLSITSCGNWVNLISFIITSEFEVCIVWSIIMSVVCREVAVLEGGASLTKVYNSTNVKITSLV